MKNIVTIAITATATSLVTVTALGLYRMKCQRDNVNKLIDIIEHNFDNFDNELNKIGIVSVEDKEYMNLYDEYQEILKITNYAIKEDKLVQLNSKLLEYWHILDD